MQILAKNARAGERYLTEQGHEIEICIHERLLLETGKTEVHKAKDGKIFYRILNESGDFVRDQNKNPIFMRLDPNYALVRKPDSKVNPESIISGKRGPKPRDKSKNPMQWRGWAYKHSDLMDQLVSIARDDGFEVVRHFGNWNTMVPMMVHYHRIGLGGFGGKTVGAIFTSGMLGFESNPKGLFSEFEKIKRDRPIVASYMPYRVWLQGIHGMGRWNDLILAYKRFLGEKKRSFKYMTSVNK